MYIYNLYMYMYKGMEKDSPKCGHFFVKSPLKISAKMLTFKWFRLLTAVKDSDNSVLRVHMK